MNNESAAKRKIGEHKRRGTNYETGFVYYNNWQTCTTLRPEGDSSVPERNKSYIVTLCYSVDATHRSMIEFSPSAERMKMKTKEIRITP